MRRCIDEKTLERFARGELRGAEEAQVDAHLEGCNRCAKRAASLPLLDEVVERLRAIEQWRERLGPVLRRLPGIEERLTTMYPGPFGGGNPTRYTGESQR